MVSKKPAPKGMLIAFEGIDGCGKSLQARMLYDALAKKGRKCVLTSEPTDRNLGQRVREELSGRGDKIDARTLQLLFSADRSDHVKKLIEPKMRDGYTVITDRYYGSTVAYGVALGLGRDWLLTISSVFPEPEHTFVFKVPVRVAYERRHQRALGEETLEAIDIQKKVAKSYEELAKMLGKKGWHTIDGNRKPEQISKDVLSYLE